eukprot:752393-Hanusia_phi.AAC.2
MSTFHPPSPQWGDQSTRTVAENTSVRGRIWNSMGVLLDYRPQPPQHSQEGGILDMSVIGLGRLWRKDSGDGRTKSLHGYSPHLICKVKDCAVFLARTAQLLMGWAGQSPGV